MKCFKNFVAVQLMSLQLKVIADGSLDSETYCCITKPNFYKTFK